MDVQSESKNLEECLKKTRYDVDFYQRDYIWSEAVVKTLLDDIFHYFETDYVKYLKADVGPEVIEKYNWYYLNTYITNKVMGRNYIVDGQQRLTTLSLIAIKLCHFTKDVEEFEYLSNVLEECFFDNDKREGYIYTIDHKKRKRVMKIIHKKSEAGKADFGLLENKTVTEETLWNRYLDIHKYIDGKNLKENKHKLESFIFYFLEKLAFVQLKIKQDDTPMVFESINDRGIRLEPFEILKGKLLGHLDKNDLDKHCTNWEKSLSLLKGKENHFFISYLTAKYVSKYLFKRCNNDYHRYIYEDNDTAKELGFRKSDSSSESNIKNFIEKDLKYYSKLYKKISSFLSPFLEYNESPKIHGTLGQYENIIAACEINDADEDEKIKTIAKEIDRLFMLLKLNGVYDSRVYNNDIPFKLSNELREKNLNEYRGTFNKILRDAIKQYGGQDVKTLLNYSAFSDIGYYKRNMINLRYFFARIEEYLHKELDKPFDVMPVVKKGKDNGLKHIDHILSNHDRNKELFDDEEEFEKERSKLGGLVLLYGSDNISLGNNLYEDKLTTYGNCDFLWTKTLSNSFYEGTNKRFEGFNIRFENETGIKFKPIENFNKDAIKERTKLLFELTKKIWEVDE